MDKRIVTIVIALVLSLVLNAGTVFAHGEAGDEPFL